MARKPRAIAFRRSFFSASDNSLISNTICGFLNFFFRQGNAPVRLSSSLEMRLRCNRSVGFHLTFLIFSFAIMSAQTYTVEALLDKAQTLMEQFEFDAALKFCRRAAKQAPRDGRVLELMGVIAMETGADDRALDVCVLSTAVKFTKVLFESDCRHAKPLCVLLSRSAPPRPRIDGFRT
jgi:hypothetical protein